MPGPTPCPRQDDSRRVVSQAGAVLLIEAVRETALDRTMSQAWSPWRKPWGVHDPDKALRMRLLARKEHPHSGAQLGNTDTDGIRITRFLTNSPVRPIAELQPRHRLRARTEDRIRAARAAGLPTTGPGKRKDHPFRLRILTQDRG